MKWLKKYSASLRALLLENFCFLCKQWSHELICEYCLADSAVSSFPLPGENLLTLPGITSNRAPPTYHALYSIGWYQHILSGLIYQLKFTDKPLCADVLARFFCIYVLNRLAQVDDLPDIIVPVPLSFRRSIKRGYNQSALIANAITRQYPIPIDHRLRRIRHTKQQSRLAKDARYQNVENAFALASPIQADHVCILDDVLTTGATVNHIALEILRHAPNTKISVWCMALAKFD